MRTIIQYIRSLFCKHEWEHLGTTKMYQHYEPGAIPCHIVDRWRCVKCGYIMKSKV